MQESFEWIEFRELTDAEVKLHPRFSLEVLGAPPPMPRMPAAPGLHPAPSLAAPLLPRYPCPVSEAKPAARLARPQLSDAANSTDSNNTGALINTTPARTHRSVVRETRMAAAHERPEAPPPRPLLSKPTTHARAAPSALAMPQQATASQVRSPA